VLYLTHLLFKASRPPVRTPNCSLNGLEQEQLGVRWDYDGEAAADSNGTVYHKFQL